MRSLWISMTALFLVLLFGVQIICTEEVNIALKKIKLSQTENQIENNSYFTISDIGIVLHALKSEIQFSFNYHSVTQNNVIYKSLNGLLPIIARPKSTIGVEYLYFITNIIINPRKADKLFPFHYFW